MKQIYLIRHGESRSQTGQTDDGVDPALTTLGERQALTLRERLTGYRFDAAFISPLRRAWRTFELSGLACPRAVYDSRAIEVEWEPGYYREAPAALPPLARADAHQAWLWPTAARIRALVEEIALSPFARVLVVGHQGIFRRFLEVFLGLPEAREPIALRVDNASVSALEIDHRGQRTVRYWNDHRHVAHLLRP